MKISKSLTILFLFCISLISLTCQATLPVPAATDGKLIPSLNSMLKKVMPAVVNIYAQGRLPSAQISLQPNPMGPPPGRPFQDTGSGVIIDANKGYIVTNAHVVRFAQSIVVTLSDGRRYKGVVVAADAPSDIAILKINATQLTAITFADSDKVQVGDIVVAIGNPFGVLTQSVTSGIVSALNRSDLGIEGYENFIQTDAPINPGNSGGALVDVQGQLVGINTAIISPGNGGGNVGIGLAISSNMVKNVADQLIQYGKVERGMLGVYVQDLTPDIADALNAHGIKGALITQISPGSPADKAGLRMKDIVLAIDDKPLTNAAQLRNTIGLTRVGNTLTLKILRDGKTMTVLATLVDKQAMLANGSSSFLAGVRIRSYDELNFNAQEIKGVQVLDLDPNSAAALKGLRPGDVILMANNQTVTSVDQLIAATKLNSKRLLLEIQRFGGNLFLVIDNN